MARVVFGTYMVRYPLGGMLNSPLQWLLGLSALGHDVYVVEKSGWTGSCFDPVSRTGSDDCAYGFGVVADLLARSGLEGKLCYVDAGERYHGLSRQAVEAAIASADVFIDYGAHGSWAEEAAAAGTRVLVDGEPGWRQIVMARDLEAGLALAEYDHYFTVGLNIGTDRTEAPTAGRAWRTTLPPLSTATVEVRPCPPAARVTTVMGWHAHDELEFRGRRYGQKDVEFERFIGLPGLVDLPLEVAVSDDAPRDRIAAKGWLVRDAIDATISFDSVWDYIHGSLAEFSVAKNVFVALNTGWFSERTAAYLAAGRPAVVQETGFGAHLPTGEGLFAVTSPEEAAEALREIAADHARHSLAARELAREHLDAPRVLGALLKEVGVA